MTRVSFFLSLLLFVSISKIDTHKLTDPFPVRELQLQLNFCLTHADCYFGGTCYKIGNAQICQCPTNYDGPNCEYAPACGSGQYYPLQKEPLDIKTPICSQCHPDCKECFGSTNSHCTACQTCEGATECQPKYLQFFKCVTQCSSGFFKEGNKCLGCNVNCQECSGPDQNNCTACNQSVELKILNTVTNTCVQNCPYGTYQNEDATQCLPCHSNCKACVGPNPDQCLACDSSKKKLGWNCLDSCPAGTIVNSEACDSICAASDQYSLTNSVSDCTQCDERCQKCTDGSTCTLCKNNYFYNILDGKCYLHCPSGTYVSQSDRICLKCPKNCETCDASGLQCQSCKEGYLKENGYCNESCNISYFQNQGHCLACSPFCKRCINSNVNGCTQCYSHPTIPIPSLFQDGQCVYSCSDGKANVDGVCLSICGINSYIFNGNCLSCPASITDFTNSEEVLAIIGSCSVKVSDKDFKASLSILAVQESRLVSVTSHNPQDAFTLLKRAINLIIGSQNAELNQSQGSMQLWKLTAANFTNFFEIDSGKDTGASIELKFPDELTSQSNTCVAITLVQDNIFGLNKIGQFEPPVIDIVAFNCNTKEIKSISKLSDPVKLKISFKGSTNTNYFAGRYFNEELQEWSSLGIQSKIVQGYLELHISHFSTFTVVQDSQGGLTLREKSSTELLPLIVSLVILGFLLISGILDAVLCCYKHDIYPHQRGNIERTHFCWVFYYSFIYNFPIIGFYSYFSVQVLSVYRVLWLSLQIWLILLIQIIAYSLLDDINSIGESFKYVVGFLTGFLLIPSTLLHFMILTEKSIRYRVSAMAKMDSQRHLKDITPLSVIAKTGMGESEQEANGTQIVNELRHVSRIEEEEKKQTVSGYAIGIVIIIALTVWIVSLLALLSQLKKLDDQSEHFYQDFIECFLSALVSGLVVSFIKIIVASSIAFHCPTRIKSHRAIRCIFVDMLTRRVSLDLSGHAIGEKQPQFQVERRSVPPSQI